MLRCFVEIDAIIGRSFLFYPVLLRLFQGLPSMLSSSSPIPIKYRYFLPVPIDQPASEQDPADNQQRFPEEEHYYDQSQNTPAVQLYSSHFRFVGHDPDYSIVITDLPIIC